MTATNGTLTQPLFPYTIELLRPCWLRLADRPLPSEALAELLRAATWRERPLVGSAVAWHPTEADADAFARLREQDPSTDPLHWPSATWTEDAPPTLVLTPTELACLVATGHHRRPPRCPADRVRPTWARAEFGAIDRHRLR